jgi:hypothetical protein
MEMKMIKLLDAFKANPTVENATKLYRYDKKHPMASAMLSREDNRLIGKACMMYTRANSVSMGRPPLSLVGM